MPIHLSEIQCTTRRIQLSFEGQPLEICYLPHRLTSRFYQALEALPEEDLHQRLDYQIQQLVQGWDLLDEDHLPLPSTPEVLRELPLGFKAAVLAGIAADIHPPEETEKKD